MCGTYHGRLKQTDLEAYKEHAFRNRDTVLLLSPVQSVCIMVSFVAYVLIWAKRNT